MARLTELEKTVLLSFLVLAKKEFLLAESVVNKFPVRQRKHVRNAIKKLEMNKFLVGHPKKESYKLSEKGLKNALKLLHEGAKLWGYLK